MKSHCCAAAVLLLSVTGATGQSLEQTFDQLGSKLEAAQQSLTRPAPTPTPGTTIYMVGETPVFSKPDTSAVTPLKLDANAPVIFQGTERGFAKVATPNAPGIFYYVPTTAINSPSLSGVVNNQIKNAMETLKGIARDLQQNPYVRMNGFSVTVSISPSLNIDFEMREAASTGSPATPNR